MSSLHQCYQHIPQLSHTHTLAQQRGPRLGALVCNGRLTNRNKHVTKSLYNYFPHSQQTYEVLF